MRALLICPAAPPGLKVLAEAGPLETTPLLGEGLVEYWLSHVAGAGTKEVFLLSHDRPDVLEQLIGNGARWGIKAQLIEETREMTRSQALAKYENLLDGTASQDGIILMDRFPGKTGLIFHSFQEFYSGLIDWIPQAKTADRVGPTEAQPGVWIGLNCNIAPSVEFRPPCWIGRNVRIGPDTVLGPGTVVEDGSFIEGLSTITGSCIGADTFVGRCCELSHSLALGETLVNLWTGLAVKVPDRFVLCGLRQPRCQESPAWFTRLVEICCRRKAEAQLLWKHLLINRGS